MTDIVRCVTSNGANKKRINKVESFWRAHESVSKTLNASKLGILGQNHIDFTFIGVGGYSEMIFVKCSTSSRDEKITRKEWKRYSGLLISSTPSYTVMRGTIDGLFDDDQAEEGREIHWSEL